MGSGRDARVAVLGDVHFDGNSRGTLRAMFARIAREADIPALVGDLTTDGDPDQVRGLLQEMRGADLPTVAVLGNHDLEGGRGDRIGEVLRERAIHVLDGDSVVIHGVGFAGPKVFGGGFGRRTLGGFGEPLFKEFVHAAMEESLKLETALRTLRAEVRVALIHNAPIRETLAGEPPETFPFLGTSRLLPPMETYAPGAVFHGHAHGGSPSARTPSGVPVFNVATSVLSRRAGKPYRVWTTRRPSRGERR